jgi:hypothetical protein
MVRLQMIMGTQRYALETDVDIYRCTHEQMKNSSLFLGDVADSITCLLETELKADGAVLRQQL